jgi:predicted lipase
VFIDGLGGFAHAQAASAKTIVAAVKRVFSDHGISHVTLVGHSLGAAISTIEGVYLKLALPPSTTFKHVLHGSPRVGNRQFANYIDAHASTQSILFNFFHSQ